MPDDPEWENAEVVVDSSDVKRALAEQRVLAYTGDAGVTTPYESDGYGRGPKAEVDTSWFPALSYDDFDLKYKLPPTVDSTAKWAAFYLNGKQKAGPTSTWCEWFLRAIMR